jgi:RNA polymerase sigma factor (sigma-70 family)
MDTPATLLRRLRDRPVPQDWERFVSLFTPVLRRWSIRLGVAARDIEDILQEVFVLLIQELPRFEYDPARSFRAWLWTVFRRITLAWHKRQPRATFSAEHLEELISPDGLAEATEAEYHRTLLNRLMQDVQLDCPTQTWAIFQRFALEARPAADVAREFGVTINAVYLTRGRIMARLREEFADLRE